MSYLEFHRWILAAVLVMARFGGAFAICPALTESMIPGVARRAATLGFAALAIPYIHAGMPPGEPSVLMFGVAALKEALEATRAHWGVESLHWVLDMVLEEDRSRARDRIAEIGRAHV